MKKFHMLFDVVLKEFLFKDFYNQLGGKSSFSILARLVFTAHKPVMYLVYIICELCYVFDELISTDFEFMYFITMKRQLIPMTFLLCILFFPVYPSSIRRYSLKHKEMND